MPSAMSDPQIRIELPNAKRPCALINGHGVALADVDVDWLLTLFREHGALLLTGFDGDTESFQALAGRIAPTSVFNESPGRETLDEKTNLQTVNLGPDPFPLHPELSREPWRPDVASFYCVEPDREGGETTICDGIGIVDNLPPALVDEMAERQLLYIRAASPAALRYWLGTDFPSEEQLRNPPEGCPYWFRRAGPRIIRGFVRPLLYKPLFDERLAFGNFLLFAHDYLRIANQPVLDDGQPFPRPWLSAVREAAAPITYPIPWKAGDMAILDNSRFMHGRRPILDPGQRRIATYFGYLDGISGQAGEPDDPIWRREMFIPPDAAAGTGRDAN